MWDEINGDEYLRRAAAARGRHVARRARARGRAARARRSAAPCPLFVARRALCSLDALQHALG